MAIAAIIAVAALLIWGFGSIIARLAGAIAVFEGLLRIGFTGSTPTAYAILAAGLAIWMTGHWIWAFKHKAWRTRLARTAYSLPGLHHLAPIPTNRTTTHTTKQAPRTAVWPSNHQNLSR